MARVGKLVGIAAGLATAAWCSLAAAADVKSAPYGKTADGQAVTAYTLTNDKGDSVTLINYGASIAAIRVPDKAGKRDNVVMSYAGMDGWEAFGHVNAILGRVSNRLTNGYWLDGKHYDLPQQQPTGVTMHSGQMITYGRRIWTVDPVAKKDTVVMRLDSPDMDQGFPGRVQMKATYRWTKNSALRLDIEATTDKPTPINPTNHIYFNLTGPSTVPVWDHELQIMADKVMVSGPNGPTGELKATAGTADDWSKPTPIKQRLALALDAAYANAQTAPPVPDGMIRSFNQSLVVTDAYRNLDKVSARLFDPVSGRVMEMRTTETTIQLYTPAAGRDGILSDANKPFTRVPAVALEPEHLPDSPNRPEFPSIVLRPGQTFHASTIWSFTTRR